MHHQLLAQPTPHTAAADANGMADFSSALARAGFWIEHAQAPHPAWHRAQKGCPGLD